MNLKKVQRQYSFNYSFETKQFTIFLKSIKLIELKINLICNNLNLNLSSDNSNLNELIYLIIDHLLSKHTHIHHLNYLLILDEEFKSSLNTFIYELRLNYYLDKILHAYEPLNLFSLKTNLKLYWTNLLESLHSTKIHDDSHQNSILLGKMYHQLIHSDYMNLIIKQEYLNTIEYNQKYNQFLLSSNSNELWSTRIDSLKNKQQRLFSKFLFKLYDELRNRKPTDRIKQNISDYLDKSDLDDDVEDLTHMSLSTVQFVDDKNAGNFRGRLLMDKFLSRIEESYTIQLGAQLKSTHNLRLVRCDILDYCKDRFKPPNASLLSSESSLTDYIEPHSMLTAMSLYSEDKLNALVLLVDSLVQNNLSANLTNKEDTFDSEDFFDISSSFYQICSKNGYDFHFQSIDQQIESSIKCINTVNKNSDSQSARMNIGDFHVTKHSNLSQTHVVFHLAAFDKQADKSLDQANRSLKNSDLSSRHPVILGLRNILKACISNNVQTITLPLLLTHQMTEEMTISWVMRRAELVLKCLKGFMIEFVQWGAQESRTLQFVVPQGLMDETFNSLSSLIKTIFRESRTYLLQ